MPIKERDCVGCAPGNATAVVTRNIDGKQYGLCDDHAAVFDKGGAGALMGASANNLMDAAAAAGYTGLEKDPPVEHWCPYCPRHNRKGLMKHTREIGTMYYALCDEHVVLFDQGALSRDEPSWRGEIHGYDD